MIIRSSKAPHETLRRVSAIALGTNDSAELFPNITEVEGLVDYLRKAGPEWKIFASDDAVGLLYVFLLDQVAVVERLYLSHLKDPTPLISDLQTMIQRAKINTLFLRSAVDQVSSFEGLGLTDGTHLIRLSGKVIETKMMPILPLAKPDTKDISGLSSLLYLANAKSKSGIFLTQADAEKRLQGVLSGLHGEFLPDASFTSGMPGGNIVSACLVTKRDTHAAEVVELFTHPLYRARGLATVEISKAMNRLAARGFSDLRVWVSEENEIAKRLFTKLGFEPDRRMAQLTLRTTAPA